MTTDSKDTDGFRVIEGGKSRKLVVVDSVRLAEKFGRKHEDVLREIDSLIAELESGLPKLRDTIASQFRADTHVDQHGREQRCYLLTEVGYKTVVMGWDPDLAFRCILAFHEAEDELSLGARSISHPLRERLQKLHFDSDA